MKKIINQWEGLISLFWINLIFLVVVFLMRHGFWLPPAWPYILFLLLAWWGVGLVFAISALKRGNLSNRIYAVITLCAFALFVLAWLWPVYSVARE